MNETNQPQLTHNNLRQFTGDLDRYRHLLNRRVIYTPGVQYLAEKGEAYWLIDEIALSFGTDEMRRAISRDPRIEDLQFWRLNVNEDRTAWLSARADSHEDPFILRKIPYTDFPLDSVDIRAGFDGQHWTLYLPSEH